MFLLGIDWLVKQVTEKKQRKTFTNASEEIYFAYDISLSSHTQKNRKAEKDRQDLGERRQILA